MAQIHRTTMTPTKLELIADWLPTRAWYTGGAAGPRLVRAGGFRLDDPEGEVGVEFMVVADGEGPEAVAYLVPMTYRGKPLDGAEHALIGTSEHGVLGTRWIYDGAHDPVLVRELAALLDGRAVPQRQSVSDAVDETVLVAAVPGLRAAEPAQAVDGAEYTEIRVRAEGDAGALTLRVHRVLRPGDATDGELGGVTAEFTPAGSEGAVARGTYVSVHRA
ncbi:maltokinase N-terminal cap-like domain-containing protein [Streptomyces hydrogenans]|uniref:maltokinase N-terminal cap-like domain-containing protein n=1 Tax=Streptomyces hydrogenans TaxID=1873719 RepID=UPI0035D667D4